MFYDITAHRISPPIQAFGGRHIAFIFITIFLSTASFQRTGIYKDELNLWTDVVKKSPFMARAHSNLGRAYEMEKMPDNSLVEFLEAIRLNPAYAPSHSNLAYIYYKKDMIDDAERELKLAIAFHKRPFEDLHRRLGLVYMRKGDIDDALKEFRKSIAMMPNHPDAMHEIAAYYTNEAWFYNDRGDFPRAIVLHNTAISIDANYADAHYGLGQAYEAMGQKEPAIKHWQEYLKLAPPDEPFRKDAMRHLKRLR